MLLPIRQIGTLARARWFGARLFSLAVEPIYTAELMS